LAQPQVFNFAGKCQAPISGTLPPSAASHAAKRGQLTLQLSIRLAERNDGVRDSRLNQKYESRQSENSRGSAHNRLPDLFSQKNRLDARRALILGEVFHDRNDQNHGADQESEFFLRVVPLHKIARVCSCNSRKAVSN
jgi:hypothetical protein